MRIEESKIKEFNTKLRKHEEKREKVANARTPIHLLFFALSHFRVGAFAFRKF
jgi:hypothetical protein